MGTASLKVSQPSNPISAAEDSAEHRRDGADGRYNAQIQRGPGRAVDQDGQGDGLYPETHIGREDAAEVFAEGGRGERRYFAGQLMPRSCGLGISAKDFGQSLLIYFLVIAFGIRG
jgi:hypothetical protein